MTFLLWPAPLFMALEVAQLVLAERHLGVRRIARGGDPRALGPSEAVSLAWVAGWIVYGAWILALFLVPQARPHAAMLAAVTGAGYAVRRSTGLGGILVVLTFEGAVRIGILGLLCAPLARALA